MIGDPARFYKTGGTLTFDDPSYIVRSADRELLEQLQAGEYCYVLTTRQMGKSSLMVRTAVTLRESGTRVVVLDLTAFGQNLTAEQWYDGLLRRVAMQLDCDDEIFDSAEWEAKTPLQRWRDGLTEIALTQAQSPLVIFIDEVDFCRSLPFATDEFFAAIRECYNRRTEDPALERLSFCLLGVASPSDLIQDPRTTPFNIGQRIELRDFTLEEAVPLAQGLGDDPGRVRKTLRRVLYWTSGHPYLTQRLCQEIARRGDANSLPDVDAICQELFLSSQALDSDDNLLFVRERMLRVEEDPVPVLDLYRRVWRGKRVEENRSDRTQEALALCGAVRARSGRLGVRNRIYATIFDKRWVNRQLPFDEKRRQRRAAWRGVVIYGAPVALSLVVVASLFWNQRLSSSNEELRRRTTELNDQTRLTQRANMKLAEKTEEIGERNKELARQSSELESEKEAIEVLLAESAETSEELRTSRESLSVAILQAHLAKAQVDRDSARPAAGLLHAARAWEFARLLNDPAKAHAARQVIDDCASSTAALQLGRPAGTAAPTSGLRLSKDATAITFVRDELLIEASVTTGRESVLASLPLRSRAFFDDECSYLIDPSTGKVEVYSDEIEQGQGVHFVRPNDDSLFAVPGGRPQRFCAVVGAGEPSIFLFSLTYGSVGARAPARQSAPATDWVEGAKLLAQATSRVQACWAAERLIPVLVWAQRHFDRVRSARFDPTGEELITGSDSGHLDVWEAATGVRLRRIKAHEAPIVGIAFVRRDARDRGGETELVTAAADGTVLHWRGEERESLAYWQQPSAEVTTLAVSRNRCVLALGGADGTVWVFGVAPLAVDSESVLAAPDSRGLVAKESAITPTGGPVGAVRGLMQRLSRAVAEVRPFNLTLQGHSAAVAHLALNEDGSVIAASTVDGAIRVWRRDASIARDLESVSADTAKAITGYVFGEDGFEAIPALQFPPLTK